MTKVVILGAGFGGLYTALELEKLIGRDPDVQVTLINRENFILFTPMLHEVAASDLDLTHIVNPIRKMLRHVKFLKAEVTSINLERRTVTVTHGSDLHSHDVPYDHLVLALGCTTNFFHLPGLEEHALTMKSLGDAIHLRNLLIDRLEEADLECAAGDRNRSLTVVVAGGGFSGVETIAGTNDFLRAAMRFYRHLSEKNLRIVLVHPGKVILPELGERLGSYAQKKLSDRGVEILVNTRVESASGEGVTLSTGEFIPTPTLVWTAGTSPHRLIGGLPCATERGRLPVNEFLEVTGWPGVWALGDCAFIRDPDAGKPYPPTAQHALRQGRQLARNIAAEVRGGRKLPFRFKTLGQLAAIGKRTGVANIMGLQFSGFLAWFLWRTIYLSKLPGLEKKVRVSLDWTLDLFFSKDLVQFQTLRAPTMGGRTGDEHHSAISASAP